MIAARKRSEDPNHLDEFIPRGLLVQTDRVRVAAAPAKAWKEVRGLNLNDSKLARTLLSLRTAPGNLAGLFRGKKAGKAPRACIDDFTGPGKGFQVLRETKGKEIVVGAIGKFWKSEIEFLELPVSEFAAFRRLGYGKIAWSLRVDPALSGGSWISWELRVAATDEASWRAFSLYWLLIGPFSHLLRRQALAEFRNRLGGSPDEERLPLPGDERLRTPRLQKTMSATLEARPEEIWPWLKQMGCQRAGWYSIDRLDNAGIPSASRILPRFQKLRVGDVLPWKPKGKEGFVVLSIDENRSLVLGSPAGNPEFSDTWAFVLEPIGSHATRLHTRVRACYQPSARMALLTPGIGVAHLIMQKAQLRNLKRRVEAGRIP